MKRFAITMGMVLIGTISIIASSKNAYASSYDGSRRENFRERNFERDHDFHRDRDRDRDRGRDRDRDRNRDRDHDHNYRREPWFFR